jgi:ABC-type transporter Mla MlaB component
MNPYRFEFFSNDQVRVFWDGELIRSDPVSLAEALLEELIEQSEHGVISRLEFDLSRAEPVNSRGLAFLLYLCDLCREASVDWRMLDLSSQAERLIHFSGLEPIFNRSDVQKIERIDSGAASIQSPPKQRSKLNV